MSREIQELEFHKNTIYRDHYRLALKGALTMVVVCIALVLVLCYQLFNPSQPAYYATTTSGDVIPLYPLSEPVVSKTFLLEWASTAARATYTLNFDQYETQLKDVSQYFTSSAFGQYEAALKSSHTLDAIVKQQLSVSAIASNQPVIIKEFIQHGRHNWIVQVPLLMTLTSSSQSRRQSVLVTMRIQRIPVLEAAKGILITDYSATSGDINAQ